MKSITWALLFSVMAAYVVSVLLFGFPGVVAYSVHFLRIAVTIGVLVLYIPSITSIFTEVPPPRRDYLLAGIVLTWLSSISFSTWNEAGRITGVDTNVFSSPVSGFFSLLLVFGGAFHLVAPNTSSKHTKIIALISGLIIATAIAIIAPYFRPLIPIQP